jgi:MFS family permease
MTALRSRPRDLAFAGVGHLFAQMIRAGRTIVVPLYAADVLGLDVRAIGFLETASSAVDLAMFIPAGLLMDRKGRKWAIVPSFIIQALGVALVPLTGNPGQLLAATCVYGLGNGLGSGSMMTLGADLAPEDTRGEFLGVWRLIGDGGATGGPVAVGAIADLLALPAAILVISGAGLIAAFVFATFVPETLRLRSDEPRVAAS